MSRRQILVFALAGTIAFAAVTAIGCGSSHPSNAGDWTYNPPEGFQQQDQQDRGDTVFKGPIEDGFQTNLRVKSGTNQNQSAEQIGKDAVSKIASQPKVSVKEQEPYTLADSDCYTWLVTKEGKSGLLASQRQFIVKKNGVVVQFTLTAPDKSMSKWDQALADSLQSFKWGR
ncbi:MAG: hypothetical protein P4L46_02365 [Fimbriimonas sp.]|nr:hypothetical protein [Fimbriimonas sp.]